MITTKLKLFIHSTLLCLFSTIVNCELISRDMLFDDPKYSQVTISPDGEDIAYLAPNEYGISNVFVKCLTCKVAKVVTFEMKVNINGKYIFI